MAMLVPGDIAALWVAVRRLWHHIRFDERGETTEKVIITALFAALALTAATIITLKVTEKANSIPTSPSSATTVANNANGGTLGP
jgi:hypothetical protein